MILINILILFIAVISNLVYLLNSLPLLSELRESYLNIESATYIPGNMHLAMRYITILFFALFCMSVYKYAVKAVKERIVTNIFETNQARGLIIQDNRDRRVGWHIGNSVPFSILMQIHFNAMEC